LAEDDLTRLAEAVADGGMPDWTAARAGAADDHARAVIGRLQAIAGIAGLHAADASSASRPAVDSAPRADPPFTWGPLRVVEWIGSGRFGDVYRAHDPGLRRDVALKLLRADDATSDEVIEEGRLAARVRHQNVVTIYGAQRLDGRTGVWMEYVDGRTLEAELADRGPFAAAEIGDIAVELCRALSAVHAAGLVHRDVKATNVMRDGAGRVVLGDFGTGHELDGSPATLAGLAGTPAYLAPEIFDRQPAMVRSDLYSLGVLLYRLATGAYPVEATSLAELRRAHAAGTRPALRGRRPDLPARLASAIERALDPNPEHRFATAAAMLAAISPRQRHRIRVVVAVTTLAIAGFAGVLWWTRQSSIPGPQGISAVHLKKDLQELAALRGPAHGNKVPCAPRRSRGVAICDLSTGAATMLRTRTVTKTATGTVTEEATSAPAVLSHDGQRLAYTWTQSANGVETDSIRIVDVDGSNDREIYRADTGRTAIIKKWLAGDSELLVFNGPLNLSPRALRVPVNGAPPSVVREFPPGQSQPAFDLSSDGRTVALERHVTPGNRDLVAIDVATGAARWEIAGAADDRLPLWTPDDRGIVFVSDRFGGHSLLYAPVRADGAIGAPQVLRDMGRNRTEPAGFGSDGSLFAIVEPPARTAFVADLGVSPGSVVDSRLLDPRTFDDTQGADWGPGGRIAYLRGPAVTNTTSHLVIRGPDGSIEREIALPGSLNRFGSHARWSPDGRRIAITYIQQERMALDIVDLDASPPQRQTVTRGLRHPRWAPSGRALYFWRSDPSVDGRPATSSIQQLDLEKDVVTTAYRWGQGGLSPSVFDVSPSGVLLVARDRPERLGGCVLRSVSPAGEEHEVLVEATKSGQCMAAAWIGDGPDVLVSLLPTFRSELWRVNMRTRERVKLPMDPDLVTDLSVSRDGRQFLYAEGNPRPDLWMFTGLPWQRGGR
jgi:serine/threonine-protein kinase